MPLFFQLLNGGDHGASLGGHESRRGKDSAQCLPLGKCLLLINTTPLLPARSFLASAGLSLLCTPVCMTQLSTSCPHLVFVHKPYPSKDRELLKVE